MPLKLCATVAQLVEQLICNQPVVGSTPISGSIIRIIMRAKVIAILTTVVLTVFFGSLILTLKLGDIISSFLYHM